MSIAAVTESERLRVFRMAEFDAVQSSRTVAEVLSTSLAGAEAQLRSARLRARLAQRHADDLDRAVHNWHDLIDEYERVTGTSVDQRTN